MSERGPSGTPMPDLPVAAPDPADDTPEFFEGTVADGLDAAVSPAKPPEWNYDYQRLIDLAARIGNCAHKIDRSKRTAEENKAALALSAQIATDVTELQEILRARQASIEGATDAD